MGAQAQTALALAVVPFGLDSQMEQELFQMLAGALPVLQAAGCALVGGHTCEGQEASLGLCVCASVSRASVFLWARTSACTHLQALSLLLHSCPHPPCVSQLSNSSFFILQL